MALANEAAALADSGQAEKAKPLLEDAAARFRRTAGRTAPERSWRLDTGAAQRNALGPCSCAAGPQAAAGGRPLDAERTDLWKTRAPDELVELALKHLNQATVIGHGKSPLSAPAEAVRDLDLDQAADEVKLAISVRTQGPWQAQRHTRSRIFCSIERDVKSAIKKL